MEALAKEIEYIRNDLRLMGNKLDQVMSFMALMQGADIQKKVDDLLEKDIRPMRSDLDSLKLFNSKLVGVYLTLAAIITLSSLSISIIALFK